MHDAALEQGHEEIALNLDDFARLRRRLKSVEKKTPRTSGLPPPTPSEAAFEAALRAACLRGSSGYEGRRRQTPSSSASSPRATSICDDPYATIGDAPRFHTKLAGVSFEGRQDVIAGLRADAPLELRREPDNPYDANAIAVCYGHLQLGFFNKRLAAHIGAAHRCRGALRRARRFADRNLYGVGTTGETKYRGVNIFVERESGGAARRRPARRAAVGANRAMRRRSRNACARR